MIEWLFGKGFYCPEYDETRGKIRENYNMKCIESNPPCPIKYKSSDVYKCKCI